MNTHIVTSFIDVNGTELANDVGLLPLPLFKGMQVTIHGYPQAFTVVDWNYHTGHPDEGAGLRIILK